MEPPSNEDKSASDKVKSQKSHQPTYENTAEYINALEKWLQEAYMWQCVSAWFPYMLMSHQLSASSSRDGNNVGFHNTATSGIRRQEDQGVIYKIPPLWKRFVAEFLDFLLLFSAKLLITIVAVDFLDVIDLDKYDLDHLQQNDEFDYQMAIDMLSELFLLELVHNFVACLFEAMCIYRGSNGRLGGATPGKSIMGLRVVMSDHIVPVSYPVGQQSGNREGTYVRVHPGSDLGFWWALCRSLVKNFCLAFFFPVCITMFFSNHNRTAYDNISHSLVVEEIPRHQN
ncbi:protein FAM8A1 isoform X2 [Ischnura elegans]|uniref:protein FAM8A1 isoform X2 n=1 Tax=Ischnura elegans TaxID=197161 RepID=UPI001ED89E61|nr:protein FAM8A1 isoform X2 [Ischnura elegans]